MIKKILAVRINNIDFASKLTPIKDSAEVLNSTVLPQVPFSTESVIIPHYSHIAGKAIGQTLDQELNWFSSSFNDIKGKSLSDDQKIAEVITRIQTRFSEGGYTYGYDIDTEGVPDYWSTPAEVVADQGKGIDCEDYAFMAQAYGNKVKGELGLQGDFIVKGGVIDKDRNPVGHAFCVYRAPDGQEYIIRGTPGDLEGMGAPTHLETLREYIERRNVYYYTDYLRLEPGTGNNTGYNVFDNSFYMKIPGKDSAEYNLLPQEIKDHFQAGDNIYISDNKVIHANSNDSPISISSADRANLLNIKLLSNNQNGAQIAAIELYGNNAFNYWNYNLQKYTYKILNFFKEKRSWLSGNSIFLVGATFLTGISALFSAFKTKKTINKIQKMRELKKAGIRINKKEINYQKRQGSIDAGNIAIESGRFGLSVSLLAGVVFSPFMALGFAFLTALKATGGFFETIFMQIKKNERFKNRKKVKQILSKNKPELSEKAERMLKARINYKYDLAKVQGGTKKGKFLNWMRMFGNLGILTGSIWGGVLAITALVSGGALGFATAGIPVIILMVSGLMVGFGRMAQVIKRAILIRRQRKEMTGLTSQELRKKKISETRNFIFRTLTRINIFGQITDKIDDLEDKYIKQPRRNKAIEVLQAVGLSLLSIITFPINLITWIFTTKDITENKFFNNLKQEYKGSSATEKRNLIKALGKYYNISEQDIYLKLIEKEDLEKNNQASIIKYKETLDKKSLGFGKNN